MLETINNAIDLIPNASVQIDYVKNIAVIAALSITIGKARPVPMVWVPD